VRENRYSLYYVDKGVFELR